MDWKDTLAQFASENYGREVWQWKLRPHVAPFESGQLTIYRDDGFAYWQPDYTETMISIGKIVSAAKQQTLTLRQAERLISQYIQATLTDKPSQFASMERVL